MSPTEFDLRAALHDGEGDGLDPDRLIAGGRARRAQRRTRLLSGTAVAVIVAGAGVGGATLLGRDSHSSGGAAMKQGPDRYSARSSGQEGTAAGAGRLPAAAPSPATPTPGSAGAQKDSPASLPAVPCPASLPRYLLPGGGSPGQFGSDGPLFSRPVAAVVVCSYGTLVEALGPNPGPNPARLVLHGAAARELADSLEHADTTRSAKACPTIRSTQERELAIIGVAADGRPVGTVTAPLNRPVCGVRVTNGTAVRYQWQPPADLQASLAALRPAGPVRGSVPNHTPPGKSHGSPVRS